MTVNLLRSTTKIVRNNKMIYHNSSFLPLLIIYLIRHWLAPLSPVVLPSHNRDVTRIFPWGGPKYRFQNFGKFQNQIFGRVGTFPNYLAVCATQHGRDFGMLSFTAKLVFRVVSQPVFYCGDVWVKR